MRSQNKNKILYIITKSNWGGAQKYVFDVATNLPKSTYEVVVALGGNGILYKKLQIADIKTIKIPHLKRDINIFSEWKVFLSLLTVIKQEQPHIVHVNSSKIGGLGALAVRVHNIRHVFTTYHSLKTKVIFTAHGWAYKEDRNIVGKKIIKFFSWLTVLLSHRTITVSENDFDQSPRFLISKKIMMIHNGISEPKFKTKTSARTEIKKLSGVQYDKNTVWIGTISELHKNKGLTYVIRAIKRLVEKKYNIVFFIIGDGEEKIRLKKFIKDLGLQNTVFLIGHLDEALTVLPAFDIFTLTSIKEGLPYSILEAGSAGIPTLASNVGGIPEIIEHKKTGVLVRPKNVHDIERELSYLVDDKKERSILGTTLREKIASDFLVDNMITETVMMYGQMK